MTIDLTADADSDNPNAAARDFFQAWRQSDMTRIAPLLAPDCEWYRDGEAIALTDGAVFRQPDITIGEPGVTAEVVNVDHHGASALLVSEGKGSSRTRRPVGFINLRFDADGIGKVSEVRLSRPTGRQSSAGPASPSVRVVRAGAKLLLLVLYFFIDELVFSIPVFAVAALWDPWRAFVLLTPLYFAFAMILGVAISRIRQRRGAVSESALQRWLDAKTARRETDWERRALIGFGFVGAGIVTIVLGPLLTPWLAHRLGLHRRNRTLVVGSVFWSICLVGTYSGLMALIL
ncbi:MAG TPA: hypothetical protein VM282_23005 [Acidimicrobiales bacterium]|nr:hypothetical protein [Acidimicrobiales bacterium]